jgi:hypothetical protein
MTETIEAPNEDAATLAQQTAALTLVMRRMHAIQRDLDVLDDAHVLEVRALTDMHHQQTASERARLESFERYALNLAELMEWPDRKKSSATPYGTVGVTDYKPTLECTDRHSLAMWAVEHRPEFAEYEMTVPVRDALERFSPEEIASFGEPDVKWKELKEELKSLKHGDALPPGVVQVPAARTPFVKVP